METGRYRTHSVHRSLAPKHILPKYHKVRSDAGKRSVLTSIEHPFKRIGGSNTQVLKGSLYAFVRAELKQSKAVLNPYVCSPHVTNTRMLNTRTRHIHNVLNVQACHVTMIIILSTALAPTDAWAPTLRLGCHRKLRSTPSIHMSYHYMSFNCTV